MHGNEMREDEVSALEKYRSLLDDARNTQTGKIHISPRQALDAADAAIAELEAENERQRRVIEDNPQYPPGHPLDGA